MDGLGRTAGQGVTFKFKDKVYTVPPTRLRHLGLAEQHILSKRIHPLDLIKGKMDGLAPEERNVLIEWAKEKMNSMLEEFRDYGIVGTDEVVRWLQTVEGYVYMLWWRLREDYEEFKDFDILRAAVMDIDEEEFAGMVKKMMQADGTDQLGNLTGQTAPAAA